MGLIMYIVGMFLIYLAGLWTNDLANWVKKRKTEKATNFYKNSIDIRDIKGMRR